MTNKDFNNLIKKLSELDSGAGQEVTMRAVKQAGGIVQSQAKLLISSDTGALARSVRVKNEVKEDMVLLLYTLIQSMHLIMNLVLALMEKLIIKEYHLK